MNEHFQDDTIVILEIANFDTQQVLALVQQDQKNLFPYLSGPKMANYWLYILNQYTNLKLINLNYISIIPDTHVMQSSIKLGIVDKTTNSQKVAEAWRTLLEGTELSPIDMHPVLWNWSRNNFLPAV